MPTQGNDTDPTSDPTTAPAPSGVIREPEFGTLDYLVFHEGAAGEALRHFEAMRPELQAAYQRGAYVWGLVKALAAPLVGWERMSVTQAKDGDRPFFVSAHEFITLPDPPAATSRAEAWLRSPEAWDLLTNALMGPIERGGAS